MSANKTILVTGAMGQLGKRVTAILLGRGHKVIALDLRNQATLPVAAALQPGPGQPGELRPAFVNLLDAEALRALLAEQRPGAIVHLAAVVAPPCYKNPQFARKVNVEGTHNLVEAAQALPQAPVFIQASSSSVYGSRNPHRHPERVTAQTPVNPVECYGEDKVAGERIVAASGLPHALLRLGGIISPDGMSSTGPEYRVLTRATPGDNRIHAVDARDAALAFANAAERGSAIDGKILLIGGNESYVLLERGLEDDLMQALGIGRLGPSASLPGDPGDDRGWGLTDWFDTTEAQALLEFQEHDWRQTLAWMAEAMGRKRLVVRALSPLLRMLMRAHFAAQRRREGRGPYANPWALVSQHYGKQILAPTDF
ncbi:SDR family oxidoreductase [Solimonas sp. K1W22B-7]|uniref:NAD-dependent epimerase/dehydratase family protein n=1 Tax=Solimonas sp. K1W22B-7 TaxID=2303331 RepID=UPI000E3374F6|nr:NAD-dependent epimerase/dehydratase family protein [Solimonas sp. K1W22B-7]AXQ27844.1 SDR family oxidoreductase [Solimonas sp. K1W22B-7]